MLSYSNSINTNTESNNDENNTIIKTHGTHIITKIEKYFSYIDYHTDCYMKKEDNTNTTEFSLIKELKIINNFY